MAQKIIQLKPLLTVDETNGVHLDSEALLLLQSVCESKNAMVAAAYGLSQSGKTGVLNQIIAEWHRYFHFETTPVPTFVLTRAAEGFKGVEMMILFNPSSNGVRFPLVCFDVVCFGDEKMYKKLLNYCVSVCNVLVFTYKEPTNPLHLFPQFLPGQLPDNVKVNGLLFTSSTQKPRDVCDYKPEVPLQTSTAKHQLQQGAFPAASVYLICKHPLTVQIQNPASHYTGGLLAYRLIEKCCKLLFSKPEISIPIADLVQNKFFESELSTIKMNLAPMIPNAPQRPKPPPIDIEVAQKLITSSAIKMALKVLPKVLLLQERGKIEVDASEMIETWFQKTQLKHQDTLYGFLKASAHQVQATFQGLLEYKKELQSILGDQPLVPPKVLEQGNNEAISKFQNMKFNEGHLSLKLLCDTIMTKLYNPLQLINTDNFNKETWIAKQACQAALTKWVESLDKIQSEGRLFSASSLAASYKDIWKQTLKPELNKFRITREAWAQAKQDLRSGIRADRNHRFERIKFPLRTVTKARTTVFNKTLAMFKREFEKGDINGKAVKSLFNTARAAAYKICHQNDQVAATQKKFLLETVNAAMYGQVLKAVKKEAKTIAIVATPTPLELSVGKTSITVKWDEQELKLDYAFLCRRTKAGEPTLVITQDRQGMDKLVPCGMLQSNHVDRDVWIWKHVSSQLEVNRREDALVMYFEEVRRTMFERHHVFPTSTKVNIEHDLASPEALRLQGALYTAGFHDFILNFGNNSIRTSYDDHSLVLKIGGSNNPITQGGASNHQPVVIPQYFRRGLSVRHPKHPKPSTDQPNSSETRRVLEEGDVLEGAGKPGSTSFYVKSDLTNEVLSWFTFIEKAVSFQERRQVFVLAV